MPTCYAYNCNHDSRKETCRFFRFPQDQVLWKKWNEACRREKPPSKWSVLCSCHFVDGNSKTVPSIFPHNVDKKFEIHFPSPEKRRKRSKSSPPPELASEEPTRELSPQPGPSSQTTGTSRLPTSSRDVLEAEIYFLNKELAELRSKKKASESQVLFFNMIEDSDTKVGQYTGLPSKAHFDILLGLISRYKVNYYDGWNVEKVSLEDQLFCTLVKLRLNLPLFVLSMLFGVADATVHNIFLTFLNVMHKFLFTYMMNKVPSKEKNKALSPACFATFPNARIVLDCTEINIAVPSLLKSQKEVYSSYKHHHTFKALIGISPNAVITFVSDLYPGSMSDKVITQQSGVLTNMEAGDLILCDKGFLISDLCAPLGVKVNIPPFLTQPQFSRSEVEATKRIARAHIHVERAIGRLKNYRILDFIPANLREHSSKILQVCACLVNLQYSLLKENESFMEG
ncbi:hypothetical protein M8J76_017221 [Diaphorina citri]|nr:hypothetical protein M8J76_017221 [Diaphorina citri]KAI5714730.1 hypothetical protein M8J77_004577 [Diaphorina citri]